ncbi:MAG: N-acyl homoserine lactonase family protein [Chloroflexota bacterium]
MTQARGITRRQMLQLIGAGGAGAVLGGGISNRITAGWFQNILSGPRNPMKGVQEPAVTHVTRSGIKIHNVQTGYVAVKTAHRQYDGPDGRGILGIALDRNWTEWMPIHTWVIEHPEGVLVVDTGETERATRSGYHQGGDAVFYGAFLRFALSAEDEIGPQLNGLGIPSEEVRWVVQTHLHGDHMGGMGYFSNAEFLISPQDYPASTGALPYHYPEWLSPTLVSFDSDPIAAFPGSYPITRARDLFIVPTPGHSNGHQSVVLRDGDDHYFFAGDTSFDDVQLREIMTPGIVADPPLSRTTLDQIQTYCRSFDTVYLPSHDPNARERLISKTFTRI